MNRFEFEQLSEAEQVRVINQYGTFTAEKIASGNRLYLYAINSFYVELLHELSDFRNKGVVVKRVFDDSRYLKEYIDDMIASAVYD
jgi:hypothetical protein